MAKQRDAVRMSEAEIAGLFNECKSLQVATLSADGAPHLTTLWFARQGVTILFETYGRSQKVVNLQRDPRIAVLCEAGSTYGELRGVSIQGRAEIVDAGDRLLALMTLLARENHPTLPHDQVARVAASMAKKRVVVVVHADKTISWDHRKLSAETKT